MDINLTAPSQVRELLKRQGVFPKKRLGQNFLVDRNTLDHLIRAMRLSPEDLVIEVGSGIGTATRELARGAGKVVAVEIDPDLIPILSVMMAGFANTEILDADILKLDLAAQIKARSESGKAKVFANLPYYITSPIIIRLIELRERIDLAVLMVQREVAERLLAQPATPDYSSLTILLRYHTRLEQIMRVSRNVFLPAPDVDSSALLMTPRESPAVKVRDERLFFNIVHAAFGKRRKTLENTLIGHSAIALAKPELTTAFMRAGIDPMRRGETLDLEEFARLADSILEVRGG